MDDPIETAVQKALIEAAGKDLSSEEVGLLKLRVETIRRLKPSE